MVNYYAFEKLKRKLHAFEVRKFIAAIAIILLPYTLQAQITNAPAPGSTDTIVPATAATATVQATPTPAPKIPVYKTISAKKFELPDGNKSLLSGIVDWVKSDSALYPDDYVIVTTSPDVCEYAKTKMDSLRLWIDGVCFTKIKPWNYNAENCTFVFQLSYDTASTSPWKLFYAWPNYTSFKHNVTINIGTLQTEFKRDQQTASLLGTSISPLFWLGYLLFIGMLVYAIWNRHSLLKNQSDCIKQGITISFAKKNDTDATTGTINIQDLPYSLSRIQFMFWLTIVFFGIIHIWGITDMLAIPNGSVLLLIGVSGGTFYVSRLIDRQDLADDLKLQPNQAVSDWQNKLKANAQRQVEVFIAEKQQSKGWFQDILSDGSVISLHRLQLVGFTTFLGIFFVWQVLYGLHLPQIDATMLMLMGISSGTYAGMKTSE